MGHKGAIRSHKEPYGAMMVHKERGKEIVNKIEKEIDIEMV